MSHKYLDKILLVHRQHNIEACHAQLRQLPEDQIENLRDYPELIWEIPNMQPPRTALERYWWQHRDITTINRFNWNYPIQIIGNPYRSAKNLLAHGTSENIVKFLQNQKDKFRGHRKTLEVLLTKYREETCKQLETGLYKRVPHEYTLAAHFIQNTGLVPRAYAWIANNNKALGEYKNEDGQPMPPAAHWCYNRKKMAMMAILWPDYQTIKEAENFPQIQELGKLKTWDPKKNPCPIEDKALAELIDWVPAKVLLEWGISKKKITEVKDKRKKEITNSQTIVLGGTQWCKKDHWLIRENRTAALLIIGKMAIAFATGEPLTETRRSLRTNGIQLEYTYGMPSSVNPPKENEDTTPWETAAFIEITSGKIADNNSVVQQNIIQQMLNTLSATSRQRLLSVAHHRLKAVEHNWLADKQQNREQKTTTQFLKELQRHGYPLETQSLSQIL